MKLPGFDGDTLICPVGSDDSSDWKPALAYPPFKKALLEAAFAAPAPAVPIDPPKPNPPAMPPPAPSVPFEPPKATQPCPRCAHANLEEAHYCNACGARIDGRLEDISPPIPAVPAKPVESAPVTAQAPTFDPFTHMDPMLSFPTEPARTQLPEPPRRPQPGKMGQLSELEESTPAKPFSIPMPALAPEPDPVPAAVPIWKRPAALALFAGAAIAAAGFAYVTLNKRGPEAVAELTSAEPIPETAPPAPITPGNAEPPSVPPPLSSPPARSSLPPEIPAERARTKTSTPAPKRTRKPRPARALSPVIAPAAAQDGGDAVESPAPKPKARRKPPAKAAAQAQGESDPFLESLLTDATKPAPEAAEEAGGEASPMIGQRPAAMPNQFSLPGLKRPVSASDRALAPQSRAPRPADQEAAPEQEPAPGDPALSEPDRSPPPPGIEDEPAKSADGDQLALVQVHEQFDFCAQLLAQGAYGDHYDTCLCKETREAAPYRGRRGFYVSAKKKDAGAGRLETWAKILTSKIDGGVAQVTARWKSGAADRGRESSQTWKLEDGLWCQAP